MTDFLCLPFDETIGAPADLDRAADFLELSAYFASDSMALTSSLTNQTRIGSSEDYADLDAEMRGGDEEFISSTVTRIEGRQRALGSSAYPFDLDAQGDLLRCNLTPDSLGQAAYMLCLVLSNLRSLSPVLDSSGLHPDRAEVETLRTYFQYFATAALATEIQGSAWSFGFPRPDGSGFVDKLTQIWRTLGDGRVERQPGAPRRPKDDQVDVFAARSHPDRLPGFLLAAAQVATGQDAREKSLKGHLGAFRSRWFARQPVTEFVVYMIVPFATADDQFMDDVRVMGNVLHRLRMPRRVAEAERLVEAGETIEGYERLVEAAQWVVHYRARAERQPEAPTSLVRPTLHPALSPYTSCPIGRDLSYASITGAGSAVLARLAEACAGGLPRAASAAGQRVRMRPSTAGATSPFAST